jgi:phosphoglycolate phosphatase-like HAD superfamily hydrolase
MRSKLLIFDWDGTLSDSVTRIALSIQLAAKDLRLQLSSARPSQAIIACMHPALLIFFQV